MNQHIEPVQCVSFIGMSLKGIVGGYIKIGVFIVK